VQYEFRRVEQETDEWEELKDDGYRTIAVNRDGIALMRRPRQRGGAEDSSTDSNTTRTFRSEPPVRATSMP
jgi:hypothetical protein